MSARLRKLAAILCAVALVGVALPAAANSRVNAKTEKAHSIPPTADILVMRPLGFVTLAGGVVLLAPALVITLITRPHELDEPFRYLIAKPAKYIWVDPLGSH